MHISAAEQPGPTSAGDRPTLCSNLPKNIASQRQASPLSGTSMCNLLIKNSLQMFFRGCCSTNLGNGIASTKTTLLRKTVRGVHDPKSSNLHDFSRLGIVLQRVSLGRQHSLVQHQFET